jgi:hypothetical protein
MMPTLFALPFWSVPSSLRRPLHFLPPPPPPSLLLLFLPAARFSMGSLLLLLRFPRRACAMAAPVGPRVAGVGEGLFRCGTRAHSHPHPRASHTHAHIHTHTHTHTHTHARARARRERAREREGERERETHTHTLMHASEPWARSTHPGKSAQRRLGP